jgi:hypothetical protein
MPVTISLSSSIGIVIPILGLCCLLPLAAAAYLEPKKDYSRRLYICMLLALRRDPGAGGTAAAF